LITSNLYDEAQTGELPQEAMFVSLGYGKTSEPTVVLSETWKTAALDRS
jgi:hypothetical protein